MHLLDSERDTVSQSHKGNECHLEQDDGGIVVRALGAGSAVDVVVAGKGKGRAP